MIAFSEEWATALGVAINNNENYKTAASTWNDSLLLVLGKAKQTNPNEDIGILLDLVHGNCKGASLATAADFDNAAFVLIANTTNWKKVLDGKIAPLMAIMRGKLKLAKGSMATLAKYSNAAKEIVASAQQLDTEIPEELLEKYG